MIVTVSKKVYSAMRVSERGKRKDKLRVQANSCPERRRQAEARGKKKKGMGHPFVNMRVV